MTPFKLAYIMIVYCVVLSVEGWGIHPAKFVHKMSNRSWNGWGVSLPITLKFDEESN